jgi:hypothetical protein
MFRIAVVVWIMLGTALAGTAMLAVLILPDLAAQAMKNIPLAVMAGFAAAMRQPGSIGSTAPARSPGTLESERPIRNRTRRLPV